MTASDSSTAVGELFRRHGSAVYRRALRLLGSSADAEEATHEIFIRVMKNAAVVDERRGQVTTWLYEVTTNYCLNQLRDGARRRALMRERVARPDEPSATPAHDDLLLVRRLLAEADEREARAVVYVHLDGMSQAEAAELMGVSQRTVSNLVDRFMKWAQARASEEDAAPARAADGRDR